jgi:predicted RecB family nuclease
VLEPDRRIPHLTKSKYVAGLQCHLRLWKQVFTPLLFEQLEPGTPQYEGTRIGELARTLFPGGVLIDNGAWDHKGALMRTADLINEGCPAIFEGAFEHHNRRVRVDVLKHVGDARWALYEVKSSTSIHCEHLHDVAFQADVLRQSGINLVSVFVVHVDNQYRRGIDGIDVNLFFQVIDVSERSRQQSAKLELNLENLTRVLGTAEPPNDLPGLHCKKPYTCEFIDQCTAKLPTDWVGRLPRITSGQLEEMAAIGVTSIADIPDNLKLRGVQETVRSAHKTGAPFVSPTLKDDLQAFGPPALYLDFESTLPGIPLYVGTGPYQHIPFLFSLHRDDGSALSHSDYIALPGDDPRRALANELIKQTASSELPIIVYSAYEQRIINELARDFPELATDLQKIVARLQDLLGLVRKTVYLPSFNGSFSIKVVGPVLAHDVTYDGLDIKDGSTAAAVYQRLVEQQEKPHGAVTKDLLSLRAYCKRDTLSMVRIHQSLIKLAGRPRGATLGQE